MRSLIIAMASMLALGTAAHASSVQKPMHRPIRVPVLMSDPYWVPDYNIVPRYRYRLEDDRVDTSPTAKPVAPPDGDYGEREVVVGEASPVKVAAAAASQPEQSLT
jgi:hypothetical protein